LNIGSELNYVYIYNLSEFVSLSWLIDDSLIRGTNSIVN